MKTTYALALAALGFLAASANAAPVDYASTTADPAPASTSITGSGSSSGTIMIYDLEPVCAIDPSNTFPVVGITADLFGESSPDNPMCNMCVSIQDGASTLIARIVGIAEGYGDGNLGMYASEIASLNSNDNGQFTNDILSWTIIDCPQPQSATV